MFYSSKHITLVLASAGLAALGFGLWDHADSYPPSTQPHSGSHYTGGSHWFSGSSSGSSFSSGTVRGGFGSTGHAVSS